MSSPNDFLIIAVTLLFVLSELVKVASSLLGQYSRLLISTKNRYFIISNYLRMNWAEINSLKSGNLNDAIIRQTDFSGFCNLNAVRIANNSIQLLAYFMLSVVISVKMTVAAVLFYLLISVVNKINHVGHNFHSRKYNKGMGSLSRAVSDKQVNKKYYKMTGYAVLNDRFKLMLKVIKESYLNITIREELQGLWVHVLGFLFFNSIFHTCKYLEVKTSRAPCWCCFGFKVYFCIHFIFP